MYIYTYVGIYIIYIFDIIISYCYVLSEDIYTF